MDDNAAVARAMAKALSAHGHLVTLAHTCSEARQSGRHDVGVFDLTLPDGDGIELCRALLAAGSVATAVFYSASVDELWLARAHKTAPVVSKDAGLPGLLSAIRACAP